MNINVESQEAILSRDIVIVPKIAKKASKINYMSVKRVFDLVISTIGLIILSPIFLILAIIVKLDSKGPVFFAHTRYGKNGKKFKMYKFRTMYENAQDMINDFTPEQMKEWKENFKLQDDPRITKVGKFLRKTSLDELPQIVNIIKGDLSIIGPRPVIEEELEKYGENKEKFLSVTPGLTGYWQANGRSSTTYEQRMEMELYYIDHISPKLDFKIFFKTIESVIKKEGAI
jgi:bacterial sugar transferase family protein